MTKFQVPLLCLLSLFIGAIGGAFFSGRYVGSLFEPQMNLEAHVSALHSMEVIKSIAENKIQDAVELEQIQLDGNIITLGYSARDGSKKTKLYAYSVLSKIAIHRKKYPFFSNEPELKQAVQTALSSSLQSLTRRSTRTQQLRSTMLFLVCVSPSLLCVRFAAGPVIFHR